MTAPDTTQWNTPRNGDFVRYVEQLTAQSAALARAHRARPSQHKFDEADSAYVEAHQASAAAPDSAYEAAQAANPAQQQPPMLDELFSRGAQAGLDPLRGKLPQGKLNSGNTR